MCWRCLCNLTNPCTRSQNPLDKQQNKNKILRAFAFHMKHAPCITFCKLMLSTVCKNIFTRIYVAKNEHAFSQHPMSSQ